MTFKVEKSSSLGQQITAMMTRVHKANQQLHAVARQLSDLENPGIIIQPGYLCGVLAGIEFSRRPEGKDWVHLHSAPANYFAPSAKEFARKTSEITKAWTSVKDRIKDDDFNSLFNLESGNAGTLTWFRRAGLDTHETCYLVDIDARWAATVESFPPDMVEILESEAFKLKKEVEHV
jgi:hypothetical protein